MQIIEHHLESTNSVDTSGIYIFGVTQDAEVTFTFEHRIFHIPGVFFARTADLKDAALYIPMGDYTACVTLRKLRDGFNIEPGSPDDEMLGAIAASLPYTKRITPGERIPREILDGSASWSVKPEHQDLARARIAQALAQVAGLPSDIGRSRTQIMAFGRSPHATLMIGQSLDTLTRDNRLRLGRFEAVTIVDAMAHEAAYIEALRESMGVLLRLPSMISRRRRDLKTDPQLYEEMVAMQALARRPRDTCRSIFASADEVFEDVLRTVNDWPDTANGLRDLRNALHRMSVDWSGLLERWEAQTVSTKGLPTLMRDTYRFLAQRYSTGQVWQRSTPC